MGLLSVLRERRSTVELRLELERAQARANLMKSTATAFAACVRALVLDIEECDAAGVLAALQDTLSRTMAEPPASGMAQSVAACHKRTLEFAEDERRWLDARDEEMRQIIEVLNSGLAAVGTGNAAYHERLLANGSRLEAASQLGDLVKMRQAITREVGELRVAVAQKRSEDAARQRELDRQVSELRTDLEKARSTAATDPLTGAANRAAFENELARRCALAAAGGEGFALAMVDVDHFKKINDTHGHAVGDRVLIALVGFCRGHVRRSDTLARWGGEELAIILPSASLRVAHRKARALCAALAKRSWAIDDAVDLQFTVSAGVTAWKAEDTPQKVFERADRALYAAKNGGRNRAERIG